MPQEFILTHAAENPERVVLIPAEDANQAQLNGARQTIIAKTWIDARCKVNTAGMYHDEGFGWRSM